MAMGDPDMGYWQYGYDGNGNQSYGPNGHSLNWNYDNPPTYSYNVNGVSESYAYDANGERVIRNSSSGINTYFVGGMWEEDSNGTQRLLYQFGGAVIAQRTLQGSNNSLLYLHGDHIGSASIAKDSGGQVISQQDFDPWGNLRSGIYGTITQTDVNYTGQVKDGSGLLYYHARYYDPYVSRFVSPDSIVPGAGNPQSFNRYSYVFNNPLNLIDPSGHCGDRKSDKKCWEAYDAVVNSPNFHTDVPTDLEDWGWDRLTILGWWLGHHISFTNSWGAAWTGTAIWNVVTALSRVGAFLGVVFDQALGLDKGNLTFNAYSDTGEGNVPGGNDAPSNNIGINMSYGNSSKSIAVIIHEIGHIVDWNASAGYGNAGWSKGVGWSEWSKATGWKREGDTYSISNKGRAGAASDYLLSPAEDFAETFTAVVQEKFFGYYSEAGVSGGLNTSNPNGYAPNSARVCAVKTAVGQGCS